MTNHAPEQPEQEPTIQEVHGGRTEDFHPWRLLGALALVILGLGAVAGLVDILVLGW
jgi:hypothetical protein